MKKRKTIGTSKIISHDDAERQRKCRKHGGKRGKSQKALYLTSRQDFILQNLRLAVVGNQQHTINNAIKVSYLICVGKMTSYPDNFNYWQKIVSWCRSFVLKEKINIDNSGAKTRKTFDMTQEQQNTLNKLMGVINTTNQQATIIYAITVATNYYTGKLPLPTTFTFWQRLRVWINLFPFS